MMLLSCCFRGPSKKKQKKKKIWENEKKNEYEYPPILSQSLISSPIICPAIIKPVSSHNLADLSDNNQSQISFASTKKEKTNVEEKEVFVQKQKFDSLQKGCSSTPISKGLKNRLFSQDLINISGIPSKTPKKVSQNVSHMLASAEDFDGSAFSVSTLHHTYHGSNPALAPSSGRPDSSIPSKSKSKQISNSNIKAIKGEEGSTHGFEVDDERSLIQGEKTNKQQIGKHGQSDVFLQITREENVKKIECLKKQQQAEIKRVKETLEAKLLETQDIHQKDLEKVMLDAKNKSNETVLHLNRQIIMERGKMFSEQQSNCKQLENEFRMKGDRLDKSVMEIEEREQSWQEEKAEVLIEVQRLKADATEMVSVLTMKYDEDTLSDDKKMSLSQEVYSLQLVVEMRTGEVRNLREQLAIATQQLEQAEMWKEKLRKATARMEDLEEQLRIKNSMEKQLSIENNQLETNMTKTNKEVDRMSKNVEALQWRIRNHFDIPLDNLTAETCRQEYQKHQKTSLSTLHSDQEKSCADYFTNHLISIPVTENKCKSTISFCAGAVETSKKMSITNDKWDDESDPKIDIVQDDKWPALNAIEINLDSSGDVDSHDEGVGDVSSDGDHPESPDFVSMQIINNMNCEEANFVGCEKNKQITDFNVPPYSDKPENINGLRSQTTSPAKERLPSRFTFDN